MDIYQKLINEAKLASARAYSPYSNFPVGACILFNNDKIYTGCNVENASYGLSLCAERNAIAGAINSGETAKIKAIAIYSPKKTMCMPCGACRQWLSEFCINEKQTKIILENNDKKLIVFELGEIFPHGFKLN